MHDFIFLTAAEMQIAYAASDRGILGAANPADDYEGRDRDVANHFWGNGRLIFEARQRKAEMGYDRLATLSLRWVREIIPSELKISRADLLELADGGNRAEAIKIIDATIRLLSAQHRAAVARGKAGDWTYDVNQHLNLSGALDKERKFRGEIAKTAEASEMEAA